MRTVVTIHGLNSGGQWQDEVRNVFSPHFQYVVIRYRHYRWLGFTKMLFEPFILIPMIVLAFWARPESYGAIALWILAIVIAAHLGSRVRRRWAMNSVKKQLGRYNGVHIIAHSLGTFLGCTAIQKFADLRVSHIVLAGCVLAQNWDWNKVRQANPFAFTKIRNEIGGKDLIPWAAYLVRWIPGLGMAGYKGFTDVAGLIHTIESPNSPCTDCTTSGVPIHNIVSSQFGHSDTFIDKGYAQRFWLPFLWDIDPPQYQKFLDLCRLADELLNDKDFYRLRVTETELLDCSWDWADGTLRAYIGKQINARAGSAPAQPLPNINLIILGVYKSVAGATAVTESDAPPNDWMTTARALNPRIAVTNAVDAALT